jgi:flavodoxin
MLRTTTTLSLLLVGLVGLFAGCSNAQQPPLAREAQSRSDQKILIVYLSRTNNTKAVAEFIRDEVVGGTLVPIETERPYPADYRATVEQVAMENENGFLPPLKTKIERIEQYDLIFVGFPTWGMQLPPPVKSFLRQHDLKGKTVVPFNTNAGYGEGSSMATVKELCQGCNVLDGFSTRGGIERDGVLLAIKDARAEEVRTAVKAWLRQIKVKE